MNAKSLFRINGLRPVSAGSALLLAGAAMLLLAARPAAADDAEAKGDDFGIRVEAGGQYADTDGDRTFIYPYSTMDSNPLLYLDIFSVSPGGRNYEIEGSFSDDQDWSAGFRYNQGANLQVGVRAQEFFHAQKRSEYPPGFETPAPGFGTVDVVPDDADAGRQYQTEVGEYTGDFRFRFPSYPGHVRGDARLYRKEGPNQLRYFFRTCSTHICHTNSRTRDLEMETQEYNIGFDSHVGPVDVVYNRNFLLFDDKAPDPVDFFGDFSQGRPVPGEFDHHVNPETESYSDQVKVNTNLTNRTVLALDYVGGKSKNTDSDITEQNRHFTANLSYTLSARHFVTARYIYDDNAVHDIDEAAATTREAIDDAVEPGTTQNIGEVSYRWMPGRGTHVHTHLRYTDVQRDDTAASDLPSSTSRWSLDVDGKYQASRDLDLEAGLARDWENDPAFAVEFTERWRYNLGATWTPAKTFSLLARYTGFFGTNDDDEALKRAYEDPEIASADLERKSDGHNVLAAATWAPLPEWSFVLSYNWALNAVDQDMLLGTSTYPDRVFLSGEAPFESRYQTARLDASWSPSKAARLTLGGMIIAGEETWEPRVDGRPDITEGLADAAHSKFVKYMVDAGVEYDIRAATTLGLKGFYADYDDRVDDASDGSGGGAMATISQRW